MAVEVREDDGRQRDDNKHQESQLSNLEEEFHQEDEIEVDERQTKESFERNTSKQEEEQNEMKEEEEEEEEEESVGEDETKPENKEARDDVEIAFRDVERETRKRKEERETIGSIEAATVINEQILTSSKSIGENEKNSKQDSASSSNVDNRTKQQLSNFDYMTASPVDMSCSSATIGKLWSCLYSFTYTYTVCLTV